MQTQRPSILGFRPRLSRVGGDGNGGYRAPRASAFLPSGERGERRPALSRIFPPTPAPCIRSTFSQYARTAPTPAQNLLLNSPSPRT